MLRLLWKTSVKSTVYDLLITEAAEQDLDKIVDYIAVTLLNPCVAGALIDSIGKCFSVLRATPLAYAKCLDEQLKKKHYRKAVINNYLMVYRVDAKTHKVYILRFFYGGQDYAEQL